MAEALTCTPAGLLEIEPCLRCASEKQLKSVIAQVLCLIVGSGRNECDPATLIAQYKCYECMSDHQMLEAIAAMLIAWAQANIELEDFHVLEDIACTSCLSPKQTMAIIIGLLCDGVNNGAILCAPVP